MTRKDEMKFHGAASLLLLTLATLLASATLTMIGSVQLAYRVQHLFHQMPAQTCPIQSDSEIEIVSSHGCPPAHDHPALETIPYYRIFRGLEYVTLAAQWRF
jgi:hypothetical protein